MDALERVATSHKDLLFVSWSISTWSSGLRTLSKAVEHARGWVATKMGLLDIFVIATMIEITRAFFNGGKQIIRSVCE